MNYYNALMLLFLLLSSTSIGGSPNAVISGELASTTLDPTPVRAGAPLGEDSEGIIDEPPTSIKPQDEFESFEANYIFQAYGNFGDGKDTDYRFFQSDKYFSNLREIDPSIRGGNYGMVRQINATHVILFATYESTILYNIRTGQSQNLGFIGHHDVVYIKSRGTFMTLGEETVSRNGKQYLMDTIVEYNAIGDILWSWKSSDYIDVNLGLQEENGDTIEVTHANSIEYYEDDTLLINMRDLDTAYLINRTDSQILWSIGRYGDFVINGGEADRITTLGHDYNRISENTFIAFDNSVGTGSPSRLVQFSINTTSMTATIDKTWETDVRAPIWGSVELLPNGNYLVNGMTEIYEVNSTNGVSRKIDIDVVSDTIRRIYQVSARRDAPYAEITSGDGLAGSDYLLNVSSWYNFNVPYSLVGTLEVSVDGLPVYNEYLSFARYWQSTASIINLGTLPFGDHNITLTVSDDAGNQFSVSKIVGIKEVLLSEDIFDTTEQGYSENVLRWDIRSSTTVMYEVILDNTLQKSGSITAGVLTLDLTSTPQGDYNVSLVLTRVNNTLLLSREYDLSIRPATAPVILNSPSSELEWDRVIILEFEVEETLPSYFMYSINNGELVTSDWNGTTVITLSGYREGSIQLDLELVDKLGQSNATSMTIEIVPASSPIVYSDSKVSLTWGTTDSISIMTSGSNQYRFYVDGYIVVSGEVTGNFMNISVDNWYQDPLTLGGHLSFIEVSDIDKTAISRIDLLIDEPLGDPYADFYINDQSLWVTSASNALGAPDGDEATISYGYDNGYITLDMGDGEEVRNGEGDDLMIFSSQGLYTVEVLVDNTYQLIGTGEGNSTFDLGDIQSARYVRIGYRAGEDVLLDALRSLHLSSPRDVVPIISFHTHEEEDIITFSWEIFGDFTWKYQIAMDGVLVQDGFADTASVNFTTSKPSDQTTIAFKISTIFGVESEYVTTIFPETSTSSTSSTQNGSTEDLPLSSIVIIVSLFVVFIVRRGKPRKL